MQPNLSCYKSNTSKKDRDKKKDVPSNYINGNGQYNDIMGMTLLIGHRSSFWGENMKTEVGTITMIERKKKTPHEPYIHRSAV